MRILIDECVDPRVKQLFPRHVGALVHEMGWGAMEDVELLKAAQQHFDVLLTIDRGIEFQQNIGRLEMGVVVAHVAKNQFVHYLASQQEIIRAIEEARPGQLSHVYCRG